jgi:hypothetical protein
MSRVATMVGAEREIFELLQPPDCRKRRFQSPNSMHLLGTLVQVNDWRIVDISTLFLRFFPELCSKSVPNLEIFLGGEFPPLVPRLVRYVE